MTTSDSDEGARHRRTVIVSGRRTSISVEVAIWDALTDVCKREECTLSDVLTLIDQRRLGASLASAIRVFSIFYFRALAGLGSAVPRVESGLAEAPAPFEIPAAGFHAVAPPVAGGIPLLDPVLEAFEANRRARLQALADGNAADTPDDAPVDADH